MKKSALTVSAFVLLSATFAQAGDWGDICSSQSCQIGLGTMLVVVYPTATTVDMSDQQNREVYVQAVKDDAAAYLAGADESALLQEAIRNLREKANVTGSDQEIAAALISE